MSKVAEVIEDGQIAAIESVAKGLRAVWSALREPYGLYGAGYYGAIEDVEAVIKGLREGTSSNRGVE